MSAEPSARRSREFSAVLISWRRWWRDGVRGSVDQAAVIAKRRDEGEMSARYTLMLCMSAGIAILGLLLSSPAVVIGAMLLSPLMDPIMGLGFSLAIGDFRWLKRSAMTLAIGTAIAVLFCALVVFFSPLQTVTSEIAARTRPNLFDLGIAFFSAVAGAYALIRGREGTIVGVAIATALMPPLAVVGFGLATLNWTVFSGALLLYFTNLMTIALTAVLMARIYGFHTNLSERQTAFKSFVILAAFVALAFPLFLSLRQIAWEANAQRVVRDELIDVFDGNAEDVDPEVEFADDIVIVSATVYTNRLFDRAEVESEASRELEASLDRQTEVTILQIESADAREAQLAQLGENRAREADSIERAERIAARLALLAGVPEDQVTVDRDRRRALVTARPLDGATLLAYAELERRIDATEPDWDIRFEPPALSLPSLTFEQIEADEDAPGPVYTLDAEGQRSLALIKWAQSRVGIPVRLEGPEDAVRMAQTWLIEDGIVAEATANARGVGTVRVSWDTGE